MTNEEIIIRIRNEPQNRNNLLMELYNQNHGMIYKATKIFSGMIEHDDVMQEAFIALIESVNGYDQEQGAFSTYFWKMLKYHLNNVYRNEGTTIRIPYNLHDKVRQYEQLKEQQLKEKQILREMNISLAELQTIKRAQSIRFIDIESKTPNTEIKISELIPDKQTNLEDDVLQAIWNEELHEAFVVLLEGYKERDKDILIQTVAFERPLKPLAEKYGISVNAASTIKKDMIRKIKHSRHYRRLEELNEYSGGLQKISKNSFYRSTTERTAIKKILEEQKLINLINKRSRNK